MVKCQIRGEGNCTKSLLITELIYEIRKEFLVFHCWALHKSKKGSLSLEATSVFGGVNVTF